MDQTVVTATTGRELGTRPSRRLRAEGKLPAVVYGLGKDPVSVSVDYTELRDALKTGAGMNTVISLEVQGADTETVIIRDVERHPIKRVVTHADFLRIDPNQKVRIRVPVHLVGDDSAVTNEGAIVEQQLFELEVEVSPQNIPNEIEVDLGTLTLDAGITVGDLNLPAGVECLVDAELPVANAVVSRAARAVDEEVDAEAEGDAEDGGEAEADSAADGGQE